MKTFISIIRGINVSGQKKILMIDLKTLYEGLGFTDVVTYIQSGNVIFRTREEITTMEIAGLVERAIFAKYNFNVPVIVRSDEEICGIISINPFLINAGINTEKLHVTFLKETPASANLDSIKGFASPPDKFAIIGKEVFLYCPDKYGETKLSNTFFEKKLKVSATTRNWKTVEKLHKIAY